MQARRASLQLDGVMVQKGEMDMEITNLSTDVLIVGGGLAGTNAAMGAAEKGAGVLVADKGNINRSGDVGGGVDHFLAFLNIELTHKLKSKMQKTTKMYFLNV